MKRDIQAIKRCAEKLEGIENLELAEQQRIVGELFDAINGALLDADLDPDLVASGHLHFAMMMSAVGRSPGEDPQEFKRAGFGGLARILAALTPTDPQESLHEAYRLTQPLQRRVDSFAEQEGRRLQETDDFAGLFASGASADFGALDEGEDDLIDQIGEIATAQELIHRGRKLIEATYGHHRVAQYLARCFGGHLEALADPEAARRSASYARQLAQLDAEAEHEKTTEEIQGALDLAFSPAGIPAATEPFDREAAGFVQAPLARTLEDGSLDEVEELLPDLAFPDWVTAKWYALFHAFGWSAEARDIDGDPRLPSFVLDAPDGGVIDVFTVEDASLLGISPDSDAAIQSWGAHYRMMTTRAILLLGLNISYLVHDSATESDEPAHALLGWYLPPLPATTADRRDAEARRDWEVLVASKIDARLETETHDADAALDLPASRKATQAAAWLERVEEDVEDRVDEIGYERTFTRYLQRAHAAHLARKQHR